MTNEFPWKPLTADVFVRTKPRRIRRAQAVHTVKCGLTGQKRRILVAILQNLQSEITATVTVSSVSAKMYLSSILSSRTDETRYRLVRCDWKFRRSRNKASTHSRVRTNPSLCASRSRTLDFAYNRPQRLKSVTEIRDASDVAKFLN